MDGIYGLAEGVRRTRDRRGIGSADIAYFAVRGGVEGLQPGHTLTAYPPTAEGLRTGW